MPFPIRCARSLLILCMVAWGFGTAIRTYRLLDDVGRGAAGAEIATDLLGVVQPTVLVVAAAFAYWAIGHRKSGGRWVGLVVALLVASFLSVGVWDTWRQFLGEPTMRLSSIPYSTREEAGIALVIGVAFMAWPTYVVCQLAFGSVVREYFDRARPAVGSSELTADEADHGQ